MAEAFIQKNGINYTLEDIEKDCWLDLLNGSLQTKNAFHQPVFGTLNMDGPALRTVVLRKVLPETKELYLHSDIRSRKITELTNNPNASWLFYNFEKKLQIRINGKASIHSSDEIADNAWNITGMNSRKTYMITTAPSSVTNVPSNGLDPIFADRDPTAAESIAGRKNFCVVVTKVMQVDWLWLNSKGHKRALFTYDDGAACTRQWLIP